MPFCRGASVATGRCRLLPLSGMPGHSSRRDDEHDVVGPLERRDEFIQVGADDGHRVGLLAVEPHMASNRVLHPSPRELPVMGEQHRPTVVGIDRYGIIVSGCGQPGSGRPALMPSLAKHRADPDIDVVVQDQAH
jgi:hypothetical protein